MIASLMNNNPTIPYPSRIPSGESEFRHHHLGCQMLFRCNVDNQRHTTQEEEEDEQVPVSFFRGFFFSPSVVLPHPHTHTTTTKVRKRNGSLPTPRSCCVVFVVLFRLLSRFVGECISTVDANETLRTCPPPLPPRPPIFERKSAREREQQQLQYHQAQNNNTEQRNDPI